MKDEEMAEEKYCKGCKWRIEQCLWAWRNTNGLKEPNEKNCSCKEVPAFLAGLKAGRPQWHDLRKDPKDVPDEGTYLVVWQNARGYRDTMIMRYEEDDEEKLHWIDGDGDCWDDDIIAWREIPKFEEIEK
jgi:hypothetical protein